MIRKAHRLDVLTLVTLGKRYQEEARGHSLFEFDEYKAVSEAMYAVQDQDSCVLLAVRGSEVVGFLYAVRSTFLWSSTPLAVDQLLYVTPEHRGGTYGMSLIKWYERWAASKSIPEVRLSVASGITEERTCKLYEALGYKPGGYIYRKEIQ